VTETVQPSGVPSRTGVNGLVVIGVGLVVFALSPWISRHMEGVH
jgi:POT family proton-dependent oligopeptide transporter